MGETAKIEWLTSGGQTDNHLLPILLIVAHYFPDIFYNLKEDELDYFKDFLIQYTLLNPKYVQDNVLHVWGWVEGARRCYKEE